MGLDRAISRLLEGSYLRHLICVTTLLLSPSLIRGSDAELTEYNKLLRRVPLKPPCSLCPGGAEFKFPDAPIPYLVLPGTRHPTCSDLDFVASLVAAESNLCAQYQANGGYCGCPGAKPKNHCTFCPKGDIPARADFRLSTGEVCKNLQTYVSFLGEDQCTSLQYDAIASNAYECGCVVSVSEVQGIELFRQSPGICTLCSDGSYPPDENKFLQLAGLTCGDYAEFVGGLDLMQCDFQTSRGIFDLFAFQCNCPDTEPPACPKKENPDLCTVSLLNTISHDEPCECYSFCDGEFVGCDSYPGKFLGEKCPRNPVSGCNFASAIDDTDGSGDKDESCYICQDSTNDIGNPDAIIPPFSGLTTAGLPPQATCRDLIDYLSDQDSDDSECQVAKVRLAHYCGCENVEPNCTLCPGGVHPSYGNKIATGDTTCGDFAGTVLTWESGTCEIGEPYLGVMAARCGCVTAEWPVCPVQENPLLCTVNRLRSTDADCECYNFCGNEFHGCGDYPGQVLEASDCPEGVPPISGCNYALAKSKRCGGRLGPGCNGGYIIQ